MEMKDSLKEFFNYLMQNGIVEEGHNPNTVVDNFLGGRR